MKTSYRRLAVGIGALGAVGLLFNCAHKPPPTPEQQSQVELEDYQAQIRNVVKDPQRADKLAALASDFQKLMLARTLAVKEYRLKVATLDANYSATRADFDALIAQNNKERTSFLREVVALRTRMASLTTDEEWEQLKNARMSGMEDAMKGTL